ncbi:MAG: hypothetical protein QW503_03740 [Sulfolobales archaeon]
MREQIVRPMGRREAEQLLSSSYASYGGIHVASAILAENGRVYY